MDVLVSASGVHQVIHPGQSKLTSFKNSTDQKCHLARWKFRRNKYRSGTVNSKQNLADE